MGRLLIALLLALACGLLPARPAQAALVAEYRFEETSYAQVVGEVSDWSGNGRHARTVGTASASTSSGYTCRGVNLPYNSGSTITAVDTGFDLSSVVGATGSISFWYYSDNTEYSDRTILDATTANNARFLLFREDNSHSPTYIDVDLGFVVTSASGAEHSLDESNVMSDRRWWHIAVTWRLVTGGGAARIQLYVDGSRVADRSFSISTAGLASGISSLYLGDSRGTSYSPSRSAGGRFDTVRIYNHELSSTEVNADKNATPSCTQLHHLELTHASATGAPGATQTFTIKACANASCSSLYTGGVTGTLTGSGSGMSVSFPSGSGFSIGSGSGSTTVQAIISPSGTVTMGLSGASPTPSNSPSVLCGMGVAAASGNSCNFTTVNALHHMRLTAASNNGVTCNPTSFTIQACSNADCSSPYTGGMSGSLNVSGGGVTVTYPSGNDFVIGSGSSSTTVSAHLVTAGTATVGLSGLSLSPSSSPAVWCGLGSSPSAGGSCAYTAATAGLLLEVPDHRAEVARGFSVRAVKTADDSLACTPAFASVSKAIRFTCAYSNPGSGTRAVRINGSALNASNDPATACDGTGRGDPGL